MEIINIKNLSFSYPGAEKKALDDINLTVENGEFIVVCGESGCGKTTLLRLIKRELSPEGDISGEIMYMGKNITELDCREAASEIGYVLQNPEMQIVTDKVWHELAFGLENLGYDAQQIRRRIAELSEFFGIEKQFREKTATLSGGQKQLLSLASILAMQPKVLILDEPTSQLDPIAAGEFISTLKKINKDLAMTVIIAEHRLEEVFSIADRVLVLEDGKKLLFENPETAGKILKNHKLLCGLPSSVRIYNALGMPENIKCPLTVREGRMFLSENFGNSEVAVEIPQRTTGENPTVKLTDVRFRYERDRQDILRDISLEAFAGENLAVLGGNGAGKTTLLGVISGLLRAYKGKVEIGGKRIEKLGIKEKYRGNIALLPQNPQTVFVKSTVKDDFAEIDRENAEEMAEKLGISHLLEKHPYDLSGGEQQRAALGKVLLTKPKILLLDEPTKGIDAYFKKTLGELLDNLKKEGLTIITVTHDVEFAAEYADVCAMLFDGEIISSDTPHAFFSDNNFYTTAASRISRHMYKNAVLCEDVVELCEKNRR